MTNPLVIVDTNVVIAGLLTGDPGSPPARILDQVLSGRLLFLLSPELLAEYRAVLLRPRIRALHRLSDEEVDSILTEITTNALWRTPPFSTDHTPPDPGDQHLWALLESEPTATLVTGDKLLLEHAPEPGKVQLPTALMSDLAE